MRIYDRFIMALRNLWRRKSRTILTILSVVIGSTSIILMLAFAQGISKSQREMIESFQGLTSINILGKDSEAGLEVNDKLINDLKNVANVEAVIPSKSIYTEIKIADTDDYEIDGSINVVPDNIFSLLTDDMLEMGNIPSPSSDDTILLGPNTEVFSKEDTGDGGFFMNPVEDFDYNSHEYFIRLGYKEESEDDGVNFGKEEKPLDSEGKEINKPQTVDIAIKIAGKLNNTSFLSGWGSYISESTYKKLKEEDDKLAFPSLNQDFDEQGNLIQASNDDKIKYENLQVVVDKPENVETAEEAIRRLGYQTNSMAEANQEIENQTRTIMLILGGIGSIAFIVSAIGIINTMLMSIYERQKEIGVMKVIGASVSDIQTMFLIESGFIGFFGGILGLLISLLVGNIINKVFAGLGDGMIGINKIIIIPVWLALVGVGFSALVGILAGYLPARRATKLSAIDALRAN